MKVGLGQIDTWVGDLEGNVARCVAAVEEAADAGADLVVLPELAITGYPPRDLLFDRSFVDAALEATRDLARRTSDGPAVLVGTVSRSEVRPPRHPGLHNVAALLGSGEVKATFAKRLLPAYDVFHEPRWFLPGTAPNPVSIRGRQVGVLVCEDLWDEGHPVHPPAELRAAGAEVLVCLAASPFRVGCSGARLAHARRAGLPVVHVNAVGAQDEIVFDGRSFVTDGTGQVRAQAPAFREAVEVVEVPFDAAEEGTSADEPAAPVLEELHHALVLGIQGFARKNSMGRAVLGLSGGVDSALVARLAADSLGPGRVSALAIPSRHTDPRSTEAAREIAGALGIRLEVVELEPLHVAARATLDAVLDESEAGGVAEENVQARLRMVVLMAHVNRHRGFLLNTSNKTEISLGYGTLYGDLAGALAPIADLTKPQVVALARHLGGVPDFVLERPPTAELAPGQVDPFDYETEAPRIEELVQSHQSDGALRRSEHKRRQFGVILKVSETAFGTGRLVPLTRR